MLSRADAAVVRRDTALPDLALVLDPDQLHARLEVSVGRRLPRPVITYLRYKPGRSCLAACRIDVDGTSVDFSAKHFSRADDKLQSVVSRSAVPGPLGSGRFVLADSSVAISVFPNDGKLRKLGWLDSQEAVMAVARRVDGEASAARAKIHALHYNPERRFVGRLTTDGRDRASVRCYRRDDYARMADKAGRLRSIGPLRLARPLVQDHHNQVVVLEWLEGRPFEEALGQTSAPRGDLTLVGAALAELHRQDAPSLPLRTAASEAATLQTLAHDLAGICPELGASASSLATQLAGRLSADHSVRPVHGDFYARQVVLSGAVAAILDLDEASLGDPAIDLGRFRADLESAVIRRRIDAASVEAITELLLEGYSLTSGARPSGVDLHAAAQLFRLAAHPFRRRERSWPERSAAILERSRALLAAHDRACAVTVVVPAAREPSAARSVTRSRVHDAFGAAGDPSMPFLSGALDPDQMAARFATALHSPSATARTEVLGIEVTRYKPGRRCLIAYDVLRRGDGRADQIALVGKVRARGPDRTTHQLLCGLWSGEFGPGATDAISVPEPVGLIAPLHMTVQSRVRGTSVERQLDGPKGRHLACRAAEAIDKLHRLSPPAARRHSLDDELRLLQQRLASVALEFPDWQHRLDALFDACARVASRVDAGPTCGIHRDFYPNQLLADGERLYLLDLDLYSAGPPALDVGNFVAHIDEYSLRRFGDPDRLGDRKQALIETYLSRSRRTTREAIDAYATLALARHIALSRLFHDRRAHTGQLLELCEARVLGCPSSRPAW